MRTKWFKQIAISIIQEHLLQTPPFRVKGFNARGHTDLIAADSRSCSQTNFADFHDLSLETKGLSLGVVGKHWNTQRAAHWRLSPPQEPIPP